MLRHIHVMQHFYDITDLQLQFCAYENAVKMRIFLGHSQSKIIKNMIGNLSAN
jgi:hypothetical protein